MEAGEVVLLVSLIILAFSNYSVCYLSRMYIRSKPFGAQTNYDLMYCDILCLVTILILTLSFTIGSSLVFRPLRFEIAQGLALGNHFASMATCFGTFLFAVVRHITIHHSSLIANLDENKIMLIVRGVNILLTSLGVTFDTVIPDEDAVLYKFLSSRTDSKTALGIGDSGLSMLIFIIAAGIFVLTNIQDELQGWKYEGWGSISKLLSQVFKVNQNPESMNLNLQQQSGGFNWSKKVGVALLSLSALSFAILYAMTPQQTDADAELVKIAGITVPFWILGVILPLMAILGNKTMTQFVKNHVNVIPIVLFFKRHNTIHPMYPVVV